MNSESAKILYTKKVQIMPTTFDYSILLFLKFRYQIMLLFTVAYALKHSIVILHDIHKLGNC